MKEDNVEVMHTILMKLASEYRPDKCHLDGQALDINLFEKLNGYLRKPRYYA